MVGPMLHHANALVPIFSSRIGAAHRVVVAMSELPLDRVGMPLSHFIEKRRRSCTKAVAGHFVLGKAHASERGVDRILRHRPIG